MIHQQFLLLLHSGRNRKKINAHCTQIRMNGSIRTGYAMSKNKPRGIIDITSGKEPWEMMCKNYIEHAMFNHLKQHIFM